jgi:hypothetical protein
VPAGSAKADILSVSIAQMARTESLLRIQKINSIGRKQPDAVVTKTIIVSGVSYPVRIQR